MYWSSEFMLGSCDLEVSANATVRMAPAHGSLPTSAEPQMASHCSEKTIALPRGWTKRVKSALILSVSLAATAFCSTIRSIIAMPRTYVELLKGLSVNRTRPSLNPTSPAPDRIDSNDRDR